MKILITGVAGYIGSQLAKYLVENKCVVYGLDINPIPAKIQNFIPQESYLQIDLSLECNKDILQKFIRKIGADLTIIHLAALKSVEDSALNPDNYWNNNFGSTLNLLDVMKFNEVKKLVFASSAAVYDPINEICNEGDSCAPISVYGKIKFAEEQLIREFSKLTNSRIAILRFFNVAGAIGHEFREASGKNLMPKILEASEKKLNFEIYGVDYPTRDGSCIRDFIHVEDLLSAILKSCEKIEKQSVGIVNLGSNQGATVLEVLTEFRKYVNVESINKNRRSGDTPTLLASNNKAKEILRWEPVHDLSSIVTLFV